MGAAQSNNNAGEGGYCTASYKYMARTYTVNMARSLKAVKFNLENRAELIQVPLLRISYLSSLRGSSCVP